VSALPITCPHHPTLPTTLEEAATLFLSAPATPLGQPWLPSTESVFRPGSVSLLRDPSHLGVWADLHDDDVFNHGTSSDQPLWELGDVFEIFLRPLPDERYFEFHLTPDNVPLKLAFPSELVFWREACFYRREPWVWNYALPGTPFVSEVARRPGGWQLWVRIPWTTLTGGEPPADRTQWLGCFCRYDADRSRPSPILSSTGAFIRKQFHDQRGWNQIVF